MAASASGMCLTSSDPALPDWAAAAASLGPRAMTPLATALCTWLARPAVVGESPCATWKY